MEASYPVIRGHGINGATSSTFTAPHLEASEWSVLHRSGIRDKAALSPPSPKVNNKFVFRTNDLILQPSCGDLSFIPAPQGQSRVFFFTCASWKPCQHLLARLAWRARLYSVVVSRLGNNRKTSGLKAQVQQRWQTLFNFIPRRITEQFWIDLKGVFSRNANIKVAAESPGWPRGCLSDKAILRAVTTEVAKNRSFSLKNTMLNIPDVQLGQSESQPH